MIKKTKLISLITLLFLSSLSAESLSNRQSYQDMRQEICELMDQAAHVEQYWQETNHSPFKKYTSTLPFRWFDVKWQTETPLKADVAQALFDKLATFLGSLEAVDVLPATIETDWHAIKTESYSLLNTCAIPSGWERNWVKYAVGSVALAATYVHLRNKLNGQTLFDIEGGAPLKEHVSRIPIPGETTAYLSNYRYSQKGGHQYLEVKNTDAAVTRSFLEAHQSPATERTPHMSDLSTHFYNEDGHTHASDWLQKHCIKPFKNLYKILFTDGQDSTSDMWKSNPEEFNRQLAEARIAYIKNASTNPDTRDYVMTIAGTTPLEKLSPDQIHAIYVKILFHFHRHAHPDVVHLIDRLYEEVPNEEAQGALAYLLRGLDPDFRTRNAIVKWFPTIAKLLDNVRQEQAAPNSPLALFISTLSLLGLEKIAQINVGLNNASREIASQQLTLAMMSTVPLAIAGYALYKGGSAVIHRMTKRTFIKPLKQDLLSLQITLNSHRYQETLDAHTTGLCRYFTIRLASYLKKLSTSERPRYAMYLEQLANGTLNAKQRIQTIECMFKEFSFLQ